MTTLKELISVINSGFKLNSAIVKNALRNYNGKECEELAKDGFCTKKYQRHVLYTCDKFEILVLCWSGNQSSGIHNHPENGCLLKVLKGNLREVSYIFKDKDEDEGDELKSKGMAYLSEGSIGYQIGKKGLHDIQNYTNHKAMSIHI